MPLNSVKYIHTVAKVCEYMMSTHSKASYRLVIRVNLVRTKAFPAHVTLISSLSSRSAASIISLFPDLSSRSVTFILEDLHATKSFMFLPSNVSISFSP